MRDGGGVQGLPAKNITIKKKPPTPSLQTASFPIGTDLPSHINMMTIVTNNMTILMLISRVLYINGRTTARRALPAFINNSVRSSYDRNNFVQISRQGNLNRRLSTCRQVASLPVDESSGLSATQEPFKVNLLTLPLPELETLIKSWKYPAFRARQIHNWIFSQGVKDIDEMTDLPLKLRDTLKERTTIGSLHLHIEQISIDGTKKRAYKLHDGQMIESVLMPYEDGRRTACISSQAGCAMGCVFCGKCFVPCDLIY